MIGARSPLAAPGVAAAPGDLIVAVDGRPVDPDLGPNALLAGKADKPVELTLRRDGADRRPVVVPLASEHAARYYDLVARQRAAVREASGGRLGYLNIPDMMARGPEREPERPTLPPRLEPAAPILVVQLGAFEQGFPCITNCGDGIAGLAVGGNSHRQILDDRGKSRGWHVSDRSWRRRRDRIDAQLTDRGASPNLECCGGFERELAENADGVVAEPE